MEPTQPNSPRNSARRRAATALAAGALAVLGMALSASVAFGGFSRVAGLVRDDVYCHVAGDCAGPPETQIVSGPSGVTHDPTPTFEFASSAGHHVKFRCRIDERPYHTCQNPYTTFRLKDGDHRLQVFAIDLQGDRDPTPAEAEFTVAADGPGNSHGHGHGHDGHHHGHGAGSASPDHGRGHDHGGHGARNGGHHGGRGSGHHGHHSTPSHEHHRGSRGRGGAHGHGHHR